MCHLHMEVGTWVRCDQENAKGTTEDSGGGGEVTEGIMEPHLPFPP